MEMGDLKSLHQTEILQLPLILLFSVSYVNNNKNPCICDVKLVILYCTDTRIFIWYIYLILYDILPT